MADRKDRKTRPIKEIVRTMAQENTGRASYKEEEIPKEKPLELEKEQQVSSEEIKARQNFRSIRVPNEPGPHLFSAQETLGR